MKRYFTIAVYSLLMAGATYTAVSCDRVEDVIEAAADPVPLIARFPFVVEVPMADIPADSYATSPEIDLDFDIDAKIKEFYPDLSVANMQSAKIEELTIELVETSGPKLSAIKNTKVYIQLPQENRRVLLGEALNNTDPDKLVFTVNKDVDVTEFLKHKENALVLEAQAYQPIENFTFKVRIRPVFSINVAFNS